MLSEAFVKGYYAYLKVKATELLKKESCLNQELKSKMKFFKSLEFEELIIQLNRLQELFNYGPEVIKFKKTIKILKNLDEYNKSKRNFALSVMPICF